MSTRMELSKNDFFPNLFGNEHLSIVRVSATSWRFARFLWQNVDDGAEDRSGWEARAWQQHLSVPGVEFYAVYSDEEPAGCFELMRAPRLIRESGGAARVLGFGLLPEFSGEGLGAALLTRVAEKAFATGANKLTFSSDRELSKAMRLICRSHGFRILEGV